ncbi:COX15/CtaA family protein [Galbibacter pacificus]|uniref:COX15/CtaA family protein n=1 Tax=Galbibacter pacificus TaxID=2996052 RepID=A0ABT6FUI0_9FLAO|nr:COX15/CtaA family protein [Galbibacter pacificus]MDG3583600.1 COX15/CtaA family protein [Galbibacter pacificus]MDG3586924.1 COX15/CtaA family protein [Galbibacter pacificus]
MKKNFRKIAKVTLVLVYLVIIAGAVVRMTGSGMGCPDWPKCFGYYVPPTNVSQLTWQAGRSFKKGQVIIVDQTLQVAKKNFTTGENYNKTHWEPYTKHDYAIFNPLHTWVEYINRLFGALAGFATLVMAFASFSFWKKNKWIPVLSWLTVFGMGFQAWLGATVVYSVLAPVRITLHMVMALLIVAMILIIIYQTKKEYSHFGGHKLFKNVLLLALLLTLVQVVLGTQVRQFIDEQVKDHGITNKSLWLSSPETDFYIHRSLSILIFITNAFLFIKNRSLKPGFSKINWIFFLIVLEIATGISMYYFNFPFGSQPLHLVIASILFGVQFYLLMESKPKKLIT